MNDAGMSTGAFIMPEDDMRGVNTQRELSEVSCIMRERIINRWLNEGVRIPDISSVYIGADVKLSPDSVIMPNVQIYGESVIGSGAYIGSGSILTNAIIGDNVRITAYAVIENSELKEGSKVGAFVYIRDGYSSIGEGSKVPHLSYMGDATLGHDVNIGAGSITCNYDGEHKNKTHIGNNCFIGSNTMFVAPVEVEDGAATAAGSVITQQVPENALGVGRARQKNIADWSLRKHIIKTQQ